MKQYAIMYLKDILSKNMAEVTDMLLTEFDEKAYIEGVKKQSYEEGEAIGEARRKPSEHS